MDEKDFEDFDEEEFEMLINGLIHPGDMFVSPDFLAGAYPAPVGGAPGGMPGGMGGMPGMAGGMGAPGNLGAGIDDIIAQAYDEEEGLE